MGRPVAIAGDIDWSDSLLPNSPETVEDPAPADKRALMPSAYDRLDLTPYRIAPGETAFGVRASWSDGYAGGFGWHSAILLYAVVNGQLRQVLAVPTVALTFLAAGAGTFQTRLRTVSRCAQGTVTQLRWVDNGGGVWLNTRLA